jgi:pantothenate kinase-related protein Tda10
LTNQIKAALGTLPTPVHAIVFSIDDLYLPYDGLISLARAHPDNALLQGRGLPGTHDPTLGAEILERLLHINEHDPALGSEESIPVSLPVFDKSAYRGYGDRSGETVLVRPPVDVVILEGWCFGFQPLPLDELEKRYNVIEPESHIIEEYEGDERMLSDVIPHAVVGSPSPQSRRYFKLHSLKSLVDINSNLKNYADLWYRYFTHFIQVDTPNYTAFGRDTYTST